MLLYHITTRQIMSRSTLVMRGAMAPPMRRDREMVLAAMNPMTGPVALTIAWMAAVILALWTCAHVLAYLTISMVVSLVVPWCQRCITRRHICATRHPMGWTVRPCLMDSPLMIFLRGRDQADKVSSGEGFNGRGDVLCWHQL